MKIKPVKNSLLLKNLLSNLAIIIALLVIIVIILYSISADKITEEIEQQIYLKLEATKEEVTSTRKGQEQQLILLSKSEEINKLIGGSQTDEFTAQANALMNNYEPYMENVLLINSTGTVVFDSNNNQIVGTDLSAREYFQKSMAGEIAHSDILVSNATGNFIEVCSVPVEKDGKIVGILATTMNTGYLKDILAKIHVEESGYAFLLDEAGNFIYHPTADMINTNLKDAGVPELTDALPDMQAGNSGAVNYSYKGDEKLTLYSPIGKWTISINAVKSEYLAAVNTMLIQVLGIGFVMLLLASVVTAINSYYTVRRIQKVQHVMGVVTRGDLTAQVDERNLKKCWEVMSCTKTDCVAYGNTNLKCWEISGTLCKDEVQADALSKIENCKKCATYISSEGDELGQMTRSLSIMVTTIRNLIKGISVVSEQLTSSSQELSSASEETTASAESISGRMEEMSTSAQNQTEYVEHINTLTHEMNELLQSAALKINQMAEEADQVNQKAKVGDEKIVSTINGIEEIRKQTEKIEQVMKELIQQSSEIGEINNIITSIAKETNLLSLNASIEAARAGESGRGFAVVAEEIGKLAVQSQKSAQGISALIDRITVSIETVHEMMDTETGYVENGINSVNESKMAFEQIEEKVSGLLAGMNEVVMFVDKVKVSGVLVTEAVEKMSGIIEESGADIEEITASTQEQTSVSEEISNSSSDLARMAEELLESVSTFQV